MNYIQYIYNIILVYNVYIYIYIRIHVYSIFIYNTWEGEESILKRLIASQWWTQVDSIAAQDQAHLPCLYRTKKKYGVTFAICHIYIYTL